MKRRAGASREHSAKVKAHMLAQADLFTTCRGCGKQITGTLEDIQRHCDRCVGR